MRGSLPDSAPSATRLATRSTMNKRKNSDESVIFIDGKWLEQAKNQERISAVVSSSKWHLALSKEGSLQVLLKGENALAFFILR